MNREDHLTLRYSEGKKNSKCPDYKTKALHFSALLTEDPASRIDEDRECGGGLVALLVQRFWVCFFFVNVFTLSQCTHQHDKV